MKKSIGLDVEPPKRECTDKKCVWHGSLPVRGKAITAIVKSVKAQQTAVVEWHYNKFIPKYERYERRKIHFHAHNPDCVKAKEGERVVVVECRPLSKTKSFVVVGPAR
ncbi:MAG: 30S ribosomal protein S17 [Candidatus Aenigmarchaeota archaeon]|nr:30S ribosomal protein S17 [Candidatus Aenigmarchaeota archaeon]